VKPILECQLYGFVDTAYLHGRPPEVVAQQLCDGGVDLIQVRAKGASLDSITQIAETVQKVTHAAGVGLVINDYFELARQLEADFCHLGQEDFFGAGFEDANQLRTKGSAPGLGLSTHRVEQAARAVRAQADYIAIGPIFSTATKPTAQPVTLDYVRWAAQNVTGPWFAIGGINLGNLDEVIAAGARRICVVSDILNASDIVARCREYKSRLIRA
jgi:thiamine-phosphate pyrophosphorylase